MMQRTRIASTALAIAGAATLVLVVAGIGGAEFLNDAPKSEWDTRITLNVVAGAVGLITIAVAGVTVRRPQLKRFGVVAALLLVVMAFTLSANGSAYERRDPCLNANINPKECRPVP